MIADIPRLEQPNSIAPRCTHPRIHPGLDAAYCPDCQRSFGPRSPEYKKALLPSPAPGPCGNCSVAAQTFPATEQFCHWAKPYSPSNRKDHIYYRYTWMEGRKLRHKHIPGGNIYSPKAQRNLLEVKLAIARHRSPQEIERLIKSFK